MKLQHRFLSILMVIGLSLLPLSSKAEEGNELLLSCTYGVLAGALVGAATLAVEDEPSEKLHRVARGASLGLYAGILLGLYVVYVVPSQLEAEEQEELENIDGGGDIESYSSLRRYSPPKFTVYPVVEENRVTGAAFNYNIIRF